MERQSNGVKIPRSSRGGKIHGYYWILYLDLRLRTLLDQRMQMTIGRAKTERPFRLTNPLANQSNRSFPRSALSVIGEDKVALEDDSKLAKRVTTIVFPDGQIKVVVEIFRRNDAWN